MQTLRAVIAAALMVAAAASAAQAQMQQDRGAERVLFGGGRGEVEQSLNVSSNAGITFFDALHIERLPPKERPPDSMKFAQGSAFLTYVFSKPYVQATASAGGFAYYRDSDREWFRYKSYSANATTGHTFQVTRKTQLTLTETLVFQPAFVGSAVTGTVYQPTLVSDPSQSLPPDVTSLEGHMLRSDSSALLSRPISRRVSLEGNYQFNPTWSFGRPDDHDTWSQSAGAGLRFQLTRHLFLRAGYRFSDTKVGPANDPHVRQHNADVQLEYNEGGTIQLTRHTRLSLSGGASAITDTHRNDRYFVVGSAVLDHDIGRTWNASLGYRRHVDFSTFFTEPLLLDTVTASFGGLIASRLSFRSDGGYSRGTVGLGHGNNNYGQANAGAVLQLGLFRYMAFSTGYYYYYRTIGDSVIVSRDVTNHSESQSVRFFITAYAPLYHRTRRANATR